MNEYNPVVPVINAIPATHARLNITYAGSNGDLPDPVGVDLDDRAILRMAKEAVEGGGVPGIAQQPADFDGFVVDRFAATADVPFARVMVRPKSAFGAV